MRAILRRWFVGGALSAAALTPGFANTIPDIPLQQQFDTADAVVIGEAIGVVAKTPRLGLLALYAKIRVTAVLKGAPGKELEFLTDPGIAELNPHCCVLNGQYLLYLRKLPHGGYGAISAYHSVFRLDANNPYNFTRPSHAAGQPARTSP